MDLSISVYNLKLGWVYKKKKIDKTKEHIKYFNHYFYEKYNFSTNL